MTVDVFDFAMDMELQGKAAYEKLAATTTLPGVKTIFEGLAADEQKHYEIVQAIKEGKTWSMTESRILDKAKNVFSDLLPEKERILGQLHEDLDAYKFGLKIETESVKLYEDMAKREQDPDTAQLYLTLANEEKKHFNIMENICDFIMRPKYYLEWREFSNLHEL